MSDWGEGYVTATSYARTYQKEMAPAHLRLLMLLRQRKAPDFSRPFRWLDLGCGGGVTATVLAAANPQGEFVGVDFSPDHVLQARELAESAGIGNVSFLEASFADILDGPQQLGAFDVLTCHGVYTWVTPENRRRIVEIMRRHLRPGGIVYLGYNAMPGWAPIAPVRHLVARLAEGLPAARAEAALDEAHAILSELREQRAGYMAANPTLERWLDRFHDHSRAYLAHEYLPEAATPAWHDEVARELSAARLGYVGSARLVENFDRLNIPEALRARIAAAEEQGLGETMRDLAVNQTFRMDVFARGSLRATPSEAEEAYTAIPLALAGPAPKRPTIKVAHGEVPIAPETAAPVLDCLAAGPATLGELVRRSEKRGVASRQARQAITALLAGRTVLPLATLSPPAEAVDACRRFNRIALERVQKGGALPCLASPLLGGGLPVSGPEQRLLARAPDAAREDPQSRSEHAAALEARLPFLEQLGIGEWESCLTPTDKPDDRPR